jgi:hypothetical protein
MLASPSVIRRYSVSVSLPEPSLAALPAAALPSGIPVGLTQVPSCTPPALKTLAAEVRGDMSAPYEQAEKLEQMLRSAPFRYDKAAAPGEGCGSINNMLASHKGTSAQFATAFVLAARLLGIPARVAVGYSAGTVSGSTETVTDADAWAWPQVELYGVGWVDFNPVPQGSSAGHTPARAKQPLPQKLKARQPVSSPVVNPELTAPPAAPHGISAVARALLALALLAALILAWVTGVWLWSRRRRQRRRQAAEPAARVLGAWDEMLIPLGQAGAHIGGRSALSVAAGAAAIVPDEAHTIGQLATLAERALYDEIDDRDADLAWQLSDRARGGAPPRAGRRVFAPSVPAGEPSVSRLTRVRRR